MAQTTLSRFHLKPAVIATQSSRLRELNSEPSAFPVGDVLGKDDMDDGRNDQVNDDEDHQGVEVSRAPEQGEEHESQQPRDHLESGALKHQDQAVSGFLSGQSFFRGDCTFK